jgi:hypothetical protein
VECATSREQESEMREGRAGPLQQLLQRDSWEGYEC